MPAVLLDHNPIAILARDNRTERQFTRQLMPIIFRRRICSERLQPGHQNERETSGAGFQHHNPEQSRLMLLERRLFHLDLWIRRFCRRLVCGFVAEVLCELILCLATSTARDRFNLLGALFLLLTLLVLYFLFYLFRVLSLLAALSIGLPCDRHLTHCSK